MIIQCTKKLLEKINVSLTQNVEEEALFSWHANLITVNRKKIVVLVNDSNRYAIVLYGLRAKDFSKFEEVILKAIKDTLLHEGIKNEVVEKLINSSPNVTFAKTKDRSLVARMNKACDSVYFYQNEFELKSLSQEIVSAKVSSDWVKNNNGDYFSPNEMMYEELENLYKKPIFSCKVVQLKVKLELEKYNVVRKIIVPYYISFKKLHEIMQIIFDWRDWHLHDFYIFDKRRPIVNIVCDEESFLYPNDVTMIRELDVKLSEYIPKYSNIKYTYDFGDNWVHNIEVEKVIEDYSKNYPVCVMGIGSAPPEDVGGEGGYKEFLRIASDPTHEEYEDIINWANSQWYNEFDIDKVNRRLKSVLKWRE